MIISVYASGMSCSRNASLIYEKHPAVDVSMDVFSLACDVG